MKFQYSLDFSERVAIDTPKQSMGPSNLPGIERISARLGDNDYQTP